MYYSSDTVLDAGETGVHKKKKKKSLARWILDSNTGHRQ